MAGIKEAQKVYDFLLSRRITAPSHRLPRSRTVIVVWESSATAQMISVFALSSATAHMITVFALSSEVKCGTLGSGHFGWSLGFLLSFLLYCVEQKGRFHSLLAGELSQKSSVSGGCRNWGNAYMWWLDIRENRNSLDHNFMFRFFCCSPLKRILNTRAIIFPKQHVCVSTSIPLRLEVSPADAFRTMRRWAMLMSCHGGDSQSFWSVPPWHEKWSNGRKGLDELCQ